MNALHSLSKSARTFLAALTLIVASSSVSAPAQATSPGTNGYIAAYGGNSINLIDPTDGSSIPLDQNPSYTQSYFDVTGDGQNIARMYQSYDGTYHNSSFDVISMQTGQAVSFGLDGTYYDTLSPDGSMIAFYEIDDNYLTIYDIATGEFSRLPVPSYLMPIWSPDSTKLALYRYDFSNPSTIAGGYFDLETGIFHAIPGVTSMPADWSPDGTKIAFMPSGGLPEIQIYDLNTNAVTLFNPGGKLDATHQAYNFIWSPDMQQIAFTQCDSTNNSCLINFGDINATNFRTSPAPFVYGTKIKWVSADSSNSVYRFWSPKNQHHFYTANFIEALSVMMNYPNDIWTYEGIAYKANPSTDCAPGESAVYRFWSDKNSSHFFTSNPAEKDFIMANYPTNIWRYEGEAFCAKAAPASGYQPVYRFWSDKLSGHFFTTNAAEKDFIIANYPTNVWRYEGIAYYVQ